MSDRRPIERADYERAMAVLYAYDLHLAEPDTPLYEHLGNLHEENLSVDARLSREELLGDRGFRRERTAAIILLENLIRGSGEVPVEVHGAKQVCATPGCPETTDGVFCLSCELKSGPQLP